MYSIQKRLIILFCIAVSVLGGFVYASEPEIVLSDSRVYTGEIYINTIEISWIGNPSAAAPKYIKYEPPKGRSVADISRKDFIVYAASGEPDNGRSVFSVTIKASKATGSGKSKVTVVYPEITSGAPLEKAIEVNEPTIHGKILRIFTFSQLFIVIFLAAVTGAGIYFIVMLFRRKKEKLNAVITNEADRDLYELNSIGRLIDKKEIDVFINQANSFVEKKIQELNENDENGSSDKLSFINDIELKRKIFKIRQVLYNARFGGYRPDVSDMEDIYQVCKSLFELRKEKILKNT